MKNLVLILLITLFLVSCETGYIESDEGWTYVMINEGGKVVIDMDVDLASFKILDQAAYAVDKNTVFHRGHPIDYVDPFSIEFFDHPQYLKDDKAVYFQQTKILFANPETFERLQFPYAKDDKWIFNGTMPFAVDSIEQFEVTSTSELRSYYTIKFFKELYEGYDWLDTTDTESVIVIERATGKTENESYEGFIKVVPE